MFPRLSVGANSHDFPPMGGHLVRDEVGDTCFVPRFAFVAGTTYEVLVDGLHVGTLDRPRVDRTPTTEVVAIFPTATEVPRNLLRFYLFFSAPMSEGRAADHLRLVDEDGDPIRGALLGTDHELWDPDRRRLTVLLDPARIKRGLVGHRTQGYPLRSGSTFGLVVDQGFRDAGGRPLRSGGERAYAVGDDERRHVDPRAWALSIPAVGTHDELEACFDRPLDHGLLARCLTVVGPDGDVVDGAARVGIGEQSWRWRPRRRWASGPHRLVVDPVLEDLAGNSVSRVFDRDMTQPEDDPRPSQPVVVPFALT